MKTIKLRADNKFEFLQQWMSQIVALKGQPPKPDEYAYLGMEDFLLKRGQEYQPVRLPKEISRGIPKQCFQN